jgi:hypothetical protein
MSHSSFGRWPRGADRRPARRRKGSTWPRRGCARRSCGASRSTTSSPRAATACSARSACGSSRPSGSAASSLAGAVANEKAGPAVLVSFLIAGVASAAAAFSYAEFAGLIPRAGSAYTYGYVVLGEFAGWFIGWDLLLEYTAIVSVVAIGISGYFGELIGFLGLSLPQWMLGAPGSETGDVPPGTYKIDLFAVLLCLLIAFVLNRGMRSAARFETWLVYLKVAIVLLVIVVGAFYIQAGNYVPFFPFGLGGAFAGAATVFFAVFGYDAMSTAAEESKDSQRHMPKAILYSLAISMVLYVLACLVLTGMVNYPRHQRRGGVRVGVRRRRAAGTGGGHLRRRDRRDPHGAVHLPARGVARGLLDEPRRPAARLAVAHLADDPRADPDHLDPRHRVRPHRRFPADR